MVGLLYVRMEGWKEGREEGLPRGHRTDPDPSQSGKKRRIVMKGKMGTSHRRGAGLGLRMGCWYNRRLMIHHIDSTSTQTRKQHGQKREDITRTA